MTLHQNRLLSTSADSPVVLLPRMTLHQNALEFVYDPYELCCYPE